MIKAGRKASTFISTISLLFGTVILAGPSPASALPSDDGSDVTEEVIEVFPGDNGPSEGMVRLEAVRANGGVDPQESGFVPAPIEPVGEDLAWQAPVFEAVDPASTDTADSTSDSAPEGYDSNGWPTGMIPVDVIPAIPPNAESPDTPLLAEPGIAEPELVASSTPYIEPTTPLPVEFVTEVQNDGEFQATVESAVTTYGGQVIMAEDGVVVVDVPTPIRPAVTAELAGRGIELRDPVDINVMPNVEPSPEYGPISPSVINTTRANLYHSKGITGKGVKIGVIDFFNVNRYWNTSEMGPKPVASSTALCLENGANCTSKIFTGVSGSTGDAHGSAVVEVIRDMAPGAEIYVASAATLADNYAILRWFKSKGVTVISRSLGSGYDSAGDGNGTLDKLVDYAAAREMIWVNSGGNSGKDNYYRQKIRLVGNDVAFGPSGNNIYLPMRGCVSLGGVRWANDWYLPASQRSDYDVYVILAPKGQPASGRVVDRGERRQNQGASPLELPRNAGCPSPGYQAYLRVVWKSGPRGGDTLEILDYGNGVAQYAQAPYSAATSIVTSKSRTMLAVGAIDPPTGKTIAPYSSQGPTNDGRVVPTLSAPSGFANSVYGSFSGTSAAAPVVAGGLALLSQAKMASNHDTLADLARHSVTDLGKAGRDTVFGTGLFRLPDPIRSFPSRASSFQPLSRPIRMLDTRPDGPPKGPSNLIGDMWYGEIRELPVRGVSGIPKNATAIAINLVSVFPNAPNYIQAFPTGYAAVGSYSNLNNDAPYQIRSNFAIIPIGSDGSISLYAPYGGNVIVDALGYFVPAAAKVKAGRFQSIGTPQRVLNTRDNNKPLSAKNPVVEVPMPKGVNNRDVTALVVTVTGAAPTQPAFIQAYPRSQPGSKGATSTVNLDQWADTANLAIVPTGGGGINLTASVMNGGNVHVIVDVIGYITSSAAPASASGRFVPVAPGRALDTRKNGGPLTDATVRTVRGSDAPGVKVPTSASGIVWNVTATETQRPGFATVWAYKKPRPATSALNWGVGFQSRAAAVISAANSGASNFAFSAGTPKPLPNADLIADVFGYFT